jgi:multidrug efflux pump subunit AcrA (membrane-fusion protein)
MWYTGDTRDLPPQVEEALQEYVDEAHSKTVAVLPLRRPPPPEEDDPNKRVEREEPIGALIVEQIEDSRLTQSLTHRAEVVCQHSSTALANALEHQNLFLMPVWRALGKTRWVVQGRTLPKTLTISAAVLAVIVFLCVWPWDFTLESKGTLEPVVRQKVFANTDGIVDFIPPKIEHKAHVKEKDLLLRMRNTQVESNLAEIQGKRDAAQEQQWNIERELREGRLKTEERLRLIGQQAEVKATLASLNAQLDVLTKKRADLEVRSPMDGEIITWDLQNRLRARPVQWGEELMRVADLSKDWQMELHMPDNRMGHITAAQKNLGEDLEVTYTLAMEPNVTRHGKVVEVQQSAEVRGDEGNTVLIKVQLDKDEMEELRAAGMLKQGATVTAKVHAGRRPVGYVLLHDVIEFLQGVWFRYF